MALSARILGVMLRIFFPESLLLPPLPDELPPPPGDMFGDVSEVLAGAPAAISSGLLSSLTSSSGTAAMLVQDSMAEDTPEPGIHDEREGESKTETIRLVATANAEDEWWFFEALAWVTVLAVEARLGSELEPRKALTSDVTMSFHRLRRQ
jgi:hypothetical protein